MANSRNDARLVIGGVPRAELLPPELELEKKAAAQRRSLFALVVVVIAAVGVAYGLVAVMAQTSQVALDEANNRSAELLAEQGKYVEVRQLAAQVDSAEQARLVATSTEIDWRTQLQALASLAPSDSVGVVLMDVTSATPFEAFSATTVPLEQPRVAQVTFTGLTSSLDGVSTWVDAMSKLEGFADASITTVSDSGGIYSFTIVVHLNETVYTGRFLDEPADADGEDK